MLLTHFFALLLATPVVYSQLASNPANLVGTWSSGSKAVSTGPSFANPTNRTFNYPRVTGISYSFTVVDPNTGIGFYEIARYRMNGNGSQPACITGVVNWAHGMYTLQTNGSITMVPFNDDGFQQIQDPCAAVSNFVEVYNDTELYQSWAIFTDPTQGLKLHLFQFDNSPLAPMFQVSTTPNMLPTQQIRTQTTSHVVAKRELVQRSSAAEQQITAGLCGAVGLSLFALMLTLGL